MTRGRTLKGRLRGLRAGFIGVPSRPLLRGVDQGDGIVVRASDVQASGDSWIDPFLVANRPQLARLDIRAEVSAKGRPHVVLHPSARIGAVPLLSPSTRRVAAGLLVQPRFSWSSLGSVYASTGFAATPEFGSDVLVPGSAREVPPWLLAGPVLQRLELLLKRLRRAFVERDELRASPRGSIDWGRWSREQVPNGAWAKLPCRFSELEDDPTLLAQVRWTLARLDVALQPLIESPVAIALRRWIVELLTRAGNGPSRRPTNERSSAGSPWLRDGVQAMGWVADERGLGGSRALDGLAWSLAVDQLWEAWVRGFAAKLAGRIGMSPIEPGALHQRLRWSGTIESMQALIPDCGLRNESRVVWIDAKYKAHLALLARHGWRRLEEALRSAHRADLHQALAYAAVARTDRVDTVLVYPELARTDARAPRAIARLSNGSRCVRLILSAVPFGFGSANSQERTLNDWRDVLLGN